MEKIRKVDPASATAKFVRAARSKLELNQERLGELLGRSKANVSAWEMGAHQPSYDQLVKLSEMSHVPLPELDGQSTTPGKDPDVFAYVGGRTPVIGEARLGEQGYYEEHHASSNQEGWVKYPMPKDGYALRCKGDSMRPRIKPGEFVVIEPNSPVHIGDEVAVQTRDGRKMIKVFANRRNGFVELHSINEEHKPITLEEHEILTMHLVGGILKPGMYYEE